MSTVRLAPDASDFSVQMDRETWLRIAGGQWIPAISNWNYVGTNQDAIVNATETALLVHRPFGVDLSSGLESAPGVKDPGRLRDLFALQAVGSDEPAVETTTVDVDQEALA